MQPTAFWETESYGVCASRGKDGELEAERSLGVFDGLTTGNVVLYAQFAFTSHRGTASGLGRDACVQLAQVLSQLLVPEPKLLLFTVKLGVCVSSPKCPRHGP